MDKFKCQRYKISRARIRRTRATGESRLTSFPKHERDANILPACFIINHGIMEEEITKTAGRRTFPRGICKANLSISHYSYCRYLSKILKDSELFTGNGIQRRKVFRIITWILWEYGRLRPHILYLPNGSILRNISHVMHAGKCS